MTQDEAVVYRGSAFTVEWYFDHRGFSSAKDYYEKLSAGI